MLCFGLMTATLKNNTAQGLDSLRAVPQRIKKPKLKLFYVNTEKTDNPILQFLLHTEEEPRDKYRPNNSTGRMNHVLAIYEMTLSQKADYKSTTL